MPVGSKIQPRNIGRFNGAARVFIDVKDIVEQSFSTSSNLKTLERIHSGGEKAFNCTKCDHKLWSEEMFLRSEKPLVGE